MDIFEQLLEIDQYLEEVEMKQEEARLFGSSTKEFGGFEFLEEGNAWLTSEVVEGKDRSKAKIQILSSGFGPW